MCRIVLPVSGTNGSGVLVAVDDQSGYVFTAAHVVAGRRGAPVCWFGGWSAKADVVVEEPSYDAVLLRLKKPSVGPRSLAAATPPMGTQIWIAGYARGTDYEESSGRLRAMIISDFGGQFVDTTAPTTGGVSGGPIYNSRREVVGLLSSRESWGSRSPGCGPFLPILKRMLAHCQRGQRPNPGLSAPLKPLGPLNPPSNPAPKVPDCRDELAMLIKSQAATQAQVDQLTALVADLAKQKATPGPPGKDGKPGLTGPAAVIDYERLALEVQKRLPGLLIYDKRIIEGQVTLEPREIKLGELLPPITVNVIKDGKVIDTEDVFLGGVLPLRLVPRELENKYYPRPRR